MKKSIKSLLAVLLAGTVLFGCGQSASVNSDGTAVAGDVKQKETISVVTTIFPEYDWVREITKGNDNVDITMLLDNGVDLHSYSPTVDDIAKISTCDLFIYVGGESDGWVEDVLAEATNKDMVVINLLDVLGDTVKEEELVEGMQGEEEEEEDAEEEEEGPEYDEHVWLSLKNAKVLCQNINEQMDQVDEANKDLYDANTTAYINALDALDQEYKAVVADANRKTVLFGDRFPFRYMVEDYDLDYYAAFVGCSAESEASFETIAFLAGKVDELGLPVIFKIEGSDGKIAETIKETSKEKNQEILTMNSMQSITSQDVADGVAYLSCMEGNLEVLKKALQ